MYLKTTLLYRLNCSPKTSILFRFSNQICFLCFSSIRLYQSLGSNPFGTYVNWSLHGPFVSHNLMPNHGSPFVYWRSRWPPDLDTLNILSVQEKELRYVCVSETKASQSQKKMGWVFLRRSTSPTYGDICQASFCKNIFSGCYVQ
jgi:hypothetical protein